MIVNIAMATAILAGLSTASPTSRSLLAKRFEDGVDCTSDIVGNNKAGLFFAIDSNGVVTDCDEAGKASAANGYRCYVATGNPDGLGDFAKCPGDPAPTKNPDGSDTNLGEAFMDTYCKVGAGPAWVSIPACYIFGYYASNGDPVAEATSGAMGICDTIFEGACTWFTGVAPEIAAGMSRPCVDDPNSNACSFANPGK